MTSIKRDNVQRKHGKFDRDRVGRPSPATAAQRRLSAARPGAARESPSHVGPRDPRFGYLRQSHD
jgi:hypothetical protein